MIARDAFPAPDRDIVVVHTSDLHIDDQFTSHRDGGDGTETMANVLDAAHRAGADAVVFAGDTFESHRLPDALLHRAAQLIEAAAIPLVVLPGNHDPAIPEAVFGRLPNLKNLHVLGVTDDEAVLFPELALEIWGNPHRDYADLNPFGSFRWRAVRWQIAVAHGHYMPIADRSIVPRPAWIFDDADLLRTGADYVALGHWNRAAKVGSGAVPAYYSGSPDYARTVNVVRLTRGGEVLVERAPLDGEWK